MFNRFRAVYFLLNEVYTVSVGYVNDYPFDILRCCDNVKSYVSQI